MKIIDNALPESLADFVEDITTRFEFQWSYVDDSSGNIEDGKRKFPAFAKPLYNYHDRNQIVDKDNFIRFEPIIQILGTVAEISKESYITRARFGMHIPDSSWDSYHGPHIDQRDKHTVVLYYVNDSSGDTYFFDEKLEVIDSVSPKKNRLIVFEGGTSHASSYPQSGQRITLNLNFNSQGN